MSAGTAAVSSLPGAARERRHPGTDPAPTPRARLATELVLFAALAVFAVAQWSRLVADPPPAGLLAAIAITTAGGGVIGLIGLGGRRGALARTAAVATAVLATAAAMVVVGLPARLLAPGNWGELIDNLSLGLAGVEDVDMPYDGGDVWLRLTLLLGAPLLLGLAAALGFWPARRRALPRIGALVCLVAIYGIAVTLDSPGSELLWGVPLLVLVAGWLWTGALPPRRAGAALAVAGAAGLLALPLAGRLDTASAWWNYESWDWFGRDREVTFEWNHTYGPLDWPRDGTTLLDVRSAEPLYWKTSVLDRFDGFTWQRADAADALAAGERLARRRAPGARLPEIRREWLTQASFEIEALSSPLVVGTGTTLAVQGLGEVTRSRDGTLSPGSGEALAGGDEYSIVAYAPQPTVSELRRAPASYPPRRFAGQVLVGLPATPPQSVDPVAEPPAGLAPGSPTAMALWGERDPELEADLAASPYAETYRLARELTAGAEHPYEAAHAIERHLASSYDYSPNVPESTYPLASFLEEDLAGYCQQFSGSMALMLRMVGIPSRVVSGFAPGSYDSERGVYEVRDLDAHAWVEVYFRGIGWVTFDPTPSAAPASSQAENTELGALLGGRGELPEQGIGRARSIEAALEGGVLPDGIGEGGGPWGTVAAIGGVAVAVAALAAAAIFWRRRRALATGASIEPQLAELRTALPRLGWKVDGEATLLELERRFSSAGRSPVAAYIAALRAHRYAPEPPPAPGPAQRRALRRALAGAGPRRRLRALIAIPPGGPAAGRA